MEYQNVSVSSYGGDSEKSTPYEQKSFTEFAKDKLDSAGREIRRRLPIAGHIKSHLIHPRRLLLNSTINEHCDVVITFKKNTAESSLLWLLQKLRSCQLGLHIVVRQHASTHTSAFYITADNELLLQTAEEIHLPKLLKSEFGGGFKEFTIRDMHCFLNSDAVSSLLNSMERARLVRHAIESARAAIDDLDALPGVKLTPHQSIVPACISSGMIKAIFPLHDMKSLERLRKKWVKSLFQPQPLDEISEYFGVKIALYFAWLGHYTTALTVPAVVGVFFWMWLKTGGDEWKDIAHVLFSLFNVLWACVYLETWKRYSNVLAYKWGTLDQRDDLLMEPRPQFQGEVCLSEVTKKPEPFYPAWKTRVWRLAFSIPITAACLAISGLTTFSLLVTQDWWERKIYYLSWIPRVILGFIIFLEEESYARIARWLNDKENYRLDNRYENHLIVKIALFQFINSFLSLFYIAFYLNDMDKLKEQLAVLLITRQIIGNVKESALPYIIENLRLAKIYFDVFGAVSPTKVPTMEELSAKFEPIVESSNGKCEDDRRASFEQHLINQAELESQLFQYDGTFTEYLEMLTQLGHVVLFSSAFPLAALCALLNNTLEIRADAFKLCHVAKRPFGVAVKSIGGWQICILKLAGKTVAGNAFHCFAVRTIKERSDRLVLAAGIVAELGCMLSLSLVVRRRKDDGEMVKFVQLIRAFTVVVQYAMEAMVFVAVVVNCALIGQSGIVHRMFPGLSDSHTVLLIVAFEHLVLVMLVALRLAVPAVPGWLATQMAKVEYQRREAIKNSHSGLLIPEISDEDLSVSRTSIISPSTMKTAMANEGCLPITGTTFVTSERKKLLTPIGKIPEIPPFRPKASSITDTDVTASIPNLSPNKTTQHKELIASSGVAGSESDLNEALPVALTNSVEPSQSSTEDEKPKGVSRARAALVKRARSIGVFSLKLRKAREAAAAKESSTNSPDNKPSPPPAAVYGGELSLIPIEKLIQMDDVN